MLRYQFKPIIMSKITLLFLYFLFIRPTPGSSETIGWASHEKFWHFESKTWWETASSTADNNWIDFKKLFVRSQGRPPFVFLFAMIVFPPNCCSFLVLKKSSNETTDCWWHGRLCEQCKYSGYRVPIPVVTTSFGPIISPRSQSFFSVGGSADKGTDCLRHRLKDFWRFNHFYRDEIVSHRSVQFLFQFLNLIFLSLQVFLKRFLKALRPF